MSNSIGTLLKITLFGESHGPAVGVVLDGFPAGFAPDFDALQAFLDRRAPGRSELSTPRPESDQPEFLSGFYRGRTNGAPITAVIRNRNAHSEAYDGLNGFFRPSHADLPAYVKFSGQNDPNGGGHFSGRLTAALCAAGGLCLQWLERINIRIFSHIFQIGAVTDAAFDPLSPQPAAHGMAVRTLDPAAAQAMRDEVLRAKSQGDSVGGSVECAVTGLPIGVGEPPFDGLENRLAQLLFAIPAVKGVEFGSGFAAAAMRGSGHNDAMFRDALGAVRTRTNHAGGILGGLSNGMPLLFRVAIKPTPSVSLPQESVSPVDSGMLCIAGRHDPCIVPRALPCVEAAAAIALMDLILEGRKWN